MARQPPNPLVEKCKEVPHLEHLELLFYEDDQKGLLRHKTTGEVVRLPNAFLGLHFNEHGMAYLEIDGAAPMWASSLLKHHLFEDERSCKSEELLERLFVVRKSQAANDGLSLEWLQDHRRSHSLLYPQDTMRGAFEERPLTLLCFQWVPQHECQCYWLLRALTNVKKKVLLKKLRKSWIPAFNARKVAGSTDHKTQGRDDIVWPESAAVPDDRDTRQGHDAFVSTRFMVFLMVLLTKHYRHCKEWLKLVFEQLLPKRVKLRVNNSAQSVRVRHCLVDLGEVTQRSAYKERMRHCKRQVPLRLRQKLRLEEVLHALWPLKDLRWLLWDLIDGVSRELEIGVHLSQFHKAPADKDAFVQSEADMRDPLVRQKRMEAALGKAWNANKRKGSKAPQTEAQRTRLRMQAEAARRFTKTLQRKKERSRYLLSARRLFNNAHFVHVGLDGGRAGGRKRWLYCVLDADTGVSAWAPPLRFQDGGYRPPDSDKGPSAAEQKRLDASSLRFLDSLKLIEATAPTTAQPVVAKQTRGPSYEQVVGLDQTLKCMFPALEEGLGSFSKPAGDRDLRLLPTLVVTSDAGPDLQSALQFLQNGLSVRMVHLWEPRHRLARELENSIAHTVHLKSSLGVAEMILNFSRGPWSGHRWFRVLQASGTPESSALLHYFRPRIARDLGWSEAETTMEQCQARLRECRFLHARGPSTTSRWDNFHQGKMSQTRNPGPSIEAPEEDQAGTMKGETRQKLWARCSNKLHCVCMALVNEGLRFDLDAWFFLSLPQSEALHTLRTELQSGPCGAFKAQMSESEGAALDICNRILEQMNSPDVWSFLGLWSGGQLLGGFARQMDLAHPEVRRQSALRKRMLDMMLALLQQKLLYASVPLFSYPQRLVLLASPCEATANAALVHLYRSYSAHQIACRTNSKWCKAYVRRSPFQLQVMKDVTAVLPVTAERLHWVQVCIFDEWSVQPASAISPLEHSVRTKDTSEHEVPLLWPSGSEKDILEYCAERGFPNVSMTVLKLLLKEEFGQDMGSSDESLVGDLLLSGIKCVLGPSDEKAADALELALHEREKDDAELLDLLQNPLFNEVLQSKQDQQKLEQAIKEAQASQRQVPSITRSIQRLRPAGKKKVKRKAVRFPGDEAWPAEVLQRFAPAEYRMYRDEFNKCIRAFHKSYNWSLSRSWGRCGKESVPARLVLRGVWTRHEALHPNDPCPWDFLDD
ncbi:unnamed protein product [Symbiodinium natans]|uniref:Uncharacterized protein n=1 Tax=Symbiodinium natans TaxID=878477 RepID=A0A812JXU6_9DINO|nr:unnamed protein product [Symbiodinium natans]